MKQSSQDDVVPALPVHSTGSRDIVVEVIWAGPAALGECPIWDRRLARLYWIDSLGQRIWRAREDGTDPQNWHLPEVVGSIGLCEDGRLIAGLAEGFALVDLSGAAPQVDRIGDPEPELSDTRLNDGKVDRQGRFWCGSMNADFTTSNASLYRLDGSLNWTRMDGGFTVSNGIAFSPDDRRMYFSDSRVDCSYQYDFDPGTGGISNRRDFVDTGAYRGRIDGATVDRNGNYWGALFEGAAVGCFSPEGQLIAKIDLPVSCPTMCSFGGTDMDTLFVTSSLFSMSDTEKAHQPHAGALFAIRGLGARGMAEPYFRCAGPSGQSAAQ